MRRRDMIGAAAASVLPVAAHGQGNAAPEALDATLAPLLGSHGLPALAAAVVQNGRVIAAGAVGTRRAGSRIPVGLDDRFHIGSCTKAFTALLAAILVDEGRISWDATVGTSLPELAPGMNSGLAGVTLDQLLSHSGGIPGDTDEIVRLYYRASSQDGLNLDELRRWLISEWRARPLAAAPGSGFVYANLGYVIAGAMLESAAGATWEELVAARIFVPLGLSTAGIGPQSSVGRVDAPLGHDVRADGTLKPMLAGPNGDVPPVIGPAGAAHMSILDLAAWAGWHAGAGRRGPALVRPETLGRVHAKLVSIPPRPGAPPGTPDGSGFYGRGWGFLQLPFTRGEVITHTGSNSFNLAMILLQPERDFGLVVATNRPGQPADQALRMLLETLYRRFAPA